jgi:2'-5' RNA ligase
MPYGIMLYFDNRTERTINSIWQALAKHNLTSSMLDEGIRPHITLAIYEELDSRPCENEMIKLLSNTPSPSIQFTHLGLFTNPEPVIFAAPLVTKVLLDFHNELHLKLADEGKRSWEFYEPGKWVPHCSLALGYKVENQAEIFRLCQEMPLPMNAQVIQMGVVNFKPVKDLFKHDFQIFEQGQSREF